MMARKLKETQSAVIDWFCPSCGKDVSMEDVKCPHCSAKFVPIGSISDEEKRLQGLQDKITAATVKKKEAKKEKTEEKKDVSSEVETGKSKRRRAVEVSAEEKIPADSPRPGTRKAFVFEALTTKGLKYSDFSPKFAKEFELDEAASLKAIKTILYHFKRDGFSVVEEKGLWKFAS